MHAILSQWFVIIVSNLTVVCEGFYDTLHIEEYTALGTGVYDFGELYRSLDPPLVMSRGCGLTSVSRDGADTTRGHPSTAPSLLWLVNQSSNMNAGEVQNGSQLCSPRLGR